MNPPSYSSQPQMQTNTRSYSPSYNPEPVVSLPPPQVFNPANADEQRWKHFLTNITSPVTTKLTVFGIFYLFSGILSFGLEARLLTNSHFTYFVGFINGFFLIALAITTLVLSRQQVYVLSNLFVVLIYQLLLTIGVFCFYGYAFSVINSHSSDCSSSIFCFNDEFRTILIVNLILCFITFCFVVANLGTISNARTPPTTPITSTYVVYTPPAQTMSHSFPNPYVMSNNNQSTSA